MLEYWVWRIEIYFYINDIDQKLKSGHHPLLTPNIPFFQFSSNSKHHPSGVKSKPGPLGPDSLLYYSRIPSGAQAPMAPPGRRPHSDFPIHLSP
jgi:hypothetical protein